MNKPSPNPERPSWAFVAGRLHTAAVALEEVCGLIASSEAEAHALRDSTQARLEELAGSLTIKETLALAYGLCYSLERNLPEKARKP